MAWFYMGKLCDIYVSSFCKTLLFNFLNIGNVYVSLLGFIKKISGEPKDIWVHLQPHWKILAKVYALKHSHDILSKSEQ